MLDLSIIIPVYNVEAYIEECLASVVAQSDAKANIECIIVDDCGPDNSAAIAKHFIDSYQGDIRFTFMQREKNGGLSAARNTGIESATGEYVYFLDSDDTIVPECMELMYGLVRRYGNVDLVQGSFYETEEEKKTTSRYKLPEYTEDKRQIKAFLLKFEGDIIPAQSRLVRRDFLLKHKLFFRNGIIHEDNYWTFFLAKHVNSMAFCPTRTYYHRYNPNSITGNINKKKEYLAYKIILTELSKQIDGLLKHKQKEYLLYNLLVAINSEYYSTDEERNNLIQAFMVNNSKFQKWIIYTLLHIRVSWIKNKLLHILIISYKY